MKFTLGKKLGLGFGIVILLMMVNTSISYTKLANIRVRQERILSLRTPTVVAGRDLQRDLNWAANKGRQYVLAGAEPERRAEAKALYDGAWNDADKDVAELTELSPRWTAQENRDRLAQIKQLLPVFRQAAEACMKHATDAPPNMVVKAGDEFTETTAANLAAIKKLLEDMASSQEAAKRHRVHKRKRTASGLGKRGIFRHKPTDYRQFRETSAQANVVSAATEEVNRNLQTVATSTEEMSATISEIAKNAGTRRSAFGTRGLARPRAERRTHRHGRSRGGSMRNGHHPLL